MQKNKNIRWHAKKTKTLDSNLGLSMQFSPTKMFYLHLEEIHSKIHYLPLQVSIQPSSHRN